MKETQRNTVAVLDWKAMDQSARTRALARPELDRGSLERDVRAIIDGVSEGGDQSLRDYTARFDGATVEALEVPSEQISAARDGIDAPLLGAMERAAARIRTFHEAGAPCGFTAATGAGLHCEARYLPIEPVGLYVPGGSAPLISTALMLSIPAAIAGCRDVVLCTPPDSKGEVNPELLAAASLGGVTRIFRVGGAQAIAAMGLGTDSIPACAKIFGPGNAWVTEAKRQIASLPGGAALDMPAGPSEVLVIADGEADPVAVAWDLLSQAEHGPDSQAIALSTSATLLRQVAEALPQLASGLPRAEILDTALENARLILIDKLDGALEVSNRYAPEHLIINTADADRLLNQVTAAGSVFLGRWTPESLGDYSSGTNHVLPTYGYARAYSGLSVTDFMRRMTVQQATPQGLADAGRDAMAMAAAEGLDAHRMAVAWRLQQLEKNR